MERGSVSRVAQHPVVGWRKRTLDVYFETRFVTSERSAESAYCRPNCTALEWGLGPGRSTIAVAPMYHGDGFSFAYAHVMGWERA